MVGDKVTTKKVKLGIILTAAVAGCALVISTLALIVALGVNPNPPGPTPSTKPPTTPTTHPMTTKPTTSPTTTRPTSDPVPTSPVPTTVVPTDPPVVTG